MGRHNSDAPAAVLVADPGSLRARLLLRWWWLAAPAGLALWPLSIGLAASAAGLLLALGTAARTLAPLLLAPRLRLVAVPRQALPAWRETDLAARRIRKAWPALGAMADPADVGPAIDRAMYQLAVLLHRRAAVDAGLTGLGDAALGLPPGAPLRAEIDARRDELRSRREELSGQIAQRIGAMRRLAELCTDHAYQAHRAELARRALERADAADPGAAPAQDAVAGLAERTEVVLAAYRELSRMRPQPSET